MSPTAPTEQPTMKRWNILIEYRNGGSFEYTNVMTWDADGFPSRLVVQRTGGTIINIPYDLVLQATFSPVGVVRAKAADELL